MFLRIRTHSKQIIAMLSQNGRPTQVAIGIAIGLIFGLIPKDNLIAVAMVAMVVFLPVNQIMAISVAIMTHLLSGVLSPVVSNLGAIVLQLPVVTGVIAALYQLPVLPWTCLDNPQVIGGVGVGWVTLLPNFALCRLVLSQVSMKLEKQALEQVADDAIQYRKTVADQTRQRLEKQVAPLKLVSKSGDESVAVSVATETRLTKSNAEAPMESRTSEAEQSSPKLPERGTSTRTTRKIQQRVLPTIFTGENNLDGNETILRETVIEVVRYRSSHAVEKQTSSNGPSSAALSLTQGTSMPAGNASTVDVKDSNSNGFVSPNVPTTTKVASSSQSISFDSGHVPGVSSNRDESLRYLLWHINGSRENVRKSSEKTA